MNADAIGSPYAHMVFIDVPRKGSFLDDVKDPSISDVAFEHIRALLRGGYTTVTIMGDHSKEPTPRRGRRGPPPTERGVVLQRMTEAYAIVARRNPGREPLKREVADVAGYTAGSLYRLRRHHSIPWPPA